jgi:hypothetical protein
MKSDTAIKEIRRQHDCGCEVCSTTSVVCPASASSYAQEILRLRAENERLRDAAQRVITECAMGVLAQHSNCLCCDTIGVHSHDKKNECHFEALRAALRTLTLVLAAAALEGMHQR